MEEKKIESKEIKMNSSQENKSNEKLSYEELNNACMEMSEQLQRQNAYIQKMHKQMQEMDIMLQTKRMDYLFKVVELSNSGSKYDFNADFVNTCVEEIQESLTIPSTEGDSEKEE